mgnify:CR=1 FL=1
MRTIISLLITALGTLSIGGPGVAHGGTLDHLVCYATKDPLKMQWSADLMATIQPEFTATGCVLKKAVEFCVPATKTNVNPAPPFPGVSGQTLQDDYICYTAKCAVPGTPEQARHRSVREPSREEVQAVEGLCPGAESAATVWSDGRAHVRRDVSGHEPAVPARRTGSMYVSPDPGRVLRQHRRRVHGNVPRKWPTVRIR